MDAGTKKIIQNWSEREGANVWRSLERDLRSEVSSDYKKI
jgi:hypothetical protein